MSNRKIGHPSGKVVDIVGTKLSNRGRNCEAHRTCGSVLGPDTLVRIRLEEIDVGQKKAEAALCVYWVTEGVDRCRVGFLPRSCIPQAASYHGCLAQVLEVLSTSEKPSDRSRSHRNYGVCTAALVDTINLEERKGPSHGPTGGTTEAVAAAQESDDSESTVASK